MQKFTFKSRIIGLSDINLFIISLAKLLVNSLKNIIWVWSDLLIRESLKGQSEDRNLLMQLMIPYEVIIIDLGRIPVVANG